MRLARRSTTVWRQWAMPSHSGTDAARENPDGRFAAPPVLSKSVLRVYVLIALVIVGLGLGLWVLWVSGSTSARIAAILMAAVVLLPTVALVLSMARRRSAVLVIEENPAEVVLRGSRFFALALLTALACIVTYPIALGVAVVRDGVEEGSATMFVVSLVVALACLPVLVMMLLGKYRLNCLVLTHDLVTYRGYRRASSAPWDALDRVEITPEPKVQLLVSGPGTAIEVPLGLMASGPVPLAEYVDDLLRHPERRPSKSRTN
ncbi:hypothetical protein [Nocardioides luteus]|uniref:hypothetical protein n=1 Tax=Nocardioides luteus TaxID=1844 RepID=UPI0018CA3772|nr:hypothetical protein [Nocardioides luteus]